MKTRTAFTLALTALSLGCAILARETIVFQGASMMPGIRDGDRLAVERFRRGDKIDLKRGDVIAFRYPEDPSKSFLKRVVALPGETVEIRDGAVFINGSRLDEPYVDPKLNAARSSYQPLTVKEHHYFVLGDNRDASNDSRAWGFLPEENIYARAISNTSTREGR
jgi:signal peptidase I